MRPLIAICIVILNAAHVRAHDESWVGASGWNLDPWLGLPLIASMILYACGVCRLWRHAGRSRGVQAWQVLWFGLGWIALVAALVSPLYRLGEGLFVAHMGEHAIIMIVAAPLIALAAPFGAIFWGLPSPWRAPIGAVTRGIRSSSFWWVSSTAWFATVLQAVALWLWHFPALYNAVLASSAVHRLQHVSFFVSALLFWWVLVNPRVRPSGYGVAVLCLFVTTLHSGFLGVLLTFARQPWYAQQGELAAQFGLTPLEDQQLAGLVMWVPGGLVYTGAALAFAALWISGSSNRTFSAGRHAILAR
jgi:putative membrane protein